MHTVQLAIENQRYGALLAGLLEQDGMHDVVFADRPDLGVAGVIVVDGGRLEDLLLFEAQPERFVVITGRDAGLLARIWDAGVRHVVFEEDPPSTAMLAVIAAELRSPQARGMAAPGSHGHKKLVPAFPLPVLNERRAGCRSWYSKNHKLL
jgi:hypothetical protein